MWDKYVRGSPWHSSYIYMDAHPHIYRHSIVLFMRQIKGTADLGSSQKFTVISFAPVKTAAENSNATFFVVRIIGIWLAFSPSFKVGRTIIDPSERMNELNE